MAKPCRIDDTVCVQLCREIVVSVLVRECLPKGCPSYCPCFGGPPEGLSVRPPGGLSEDPSGGTIRRTVQRPPGGLSEDPSCGTIRGTVQRPPEGLSEDPSGGTIRGTVPRPPEGLPGDPSGELAWEYILAVGRL